MKNVKVFCFLITSIFILTACGSKEEYRSNLLDVAEQILVNSTEVEEILEMYSTVWDVSIRGGTAIAVSDMAAQTGLSERTINKYFEINSFGNVPGDFSTNVYSVLRYYEDIGKIEDIREVSEDIKNKVNDLNSPPKDYEKAYDELLDLYTISEELIELAVNPKGSLQSFNDNKRELISDIISKHKRIEAVIPNK